VAPRPRYIRCDPGLFSGISGDMNAVQSYGLSTYKHRGSPYSQDVRFLVVSWRGLLQSVAEYGRERHTVLLCVGDGFAE
jgi:hypothetical protein